MLLRQLFDHETYTYTYLIADPDTKEAALIDPVINQLDYYLQLLAELELKLVVALDTHVHADHITALDKLRANTACKTFLGNEGEVSCADNSLKDGQKINVGNITLHVLYTPGHTDDSYSFYIEHSDSHYVFTGDTLLIRGTGRTDFQNGNSEQLYNSLHHKLLALPDETVVYPGHDYKGWTQSTIDEERKHNPRLKIKARDEFVQYMQNLKLPNPKWMDVAVPANRSCGKQ